jgi:hypothetical protein
VQCCSAEVIDCNRHDVGEGWPLTAKWSLTYETRYAKIGCNSSHHVYVKEGEIRTLMFSTDLAQHTIKHPFNKT